VKPPALPVVAGFRFAGVRCGIKRRGPDLALLVSDRPASAAAVFTQSTVPSAPVVVSRRKLRGGRARAIVANSGVSNVAMGAAGIRAAERMCASAGRALGLPAREVLCASTGVIGMPLPLGKIEAGIADAVAALSARGLPRAARAIMTTDTRPKAFGASFRVAGKRCAVVGIAKGSGMIEPRMATMLAFFATDAAVAPRHLARLWREVADETLNRVSVDGETSTSDCAVILANGAAGAPAISGVRSPGAAALRTALLEVATRLARELARDGEGATKLVTVEVEGARTGAEAERAARRIANSLLVKTALFGGDPNWGRILQTVGAGRVRLDLARTEVRLGGVPVFRAGASTGTAARARAGRRLRAAEIEIAVRLGVGQGRCRIWTCDLSYGYVRVNADYTT
jgi:glutamate N-acetyltransferase / amino-acid N-acetyltransferase